MAYPLIARIGGRKCLVVGGGRVATRRIKKLLDVGAIVTVVAPHTSLEIQEWIGDKKLTLLRREFQPGDGDGAVLSFVATNDPGANKEAAKLLKSKGSLVNIADDPDGSDFHVPALGGSGDVIFSVSTDGASPVLSSWVRDKLALALPSGVQLLAALCRSLRTVVEDKDDAAKWRKLFDSGIGEDLVLGDDEAAREKVDGVFGEGTWNELKNSKGVD